jgi:hypothetical protein
VFFSKFVKTKIIFGANLSNRPEQDHIILRDVVHTVQRTIGMVTLKSGDLPSFFFQNW